MPDPIDTAELKPCRFCGCTEFLRIHEAYDEWLVYDGEKIAADDYGEAKVEMFDAVECHACCIHAPILVWQAEPGAVWTAGQLDAYRRYLAADGGRNEYERSEARRCAGAQPLAAAA